jgi:hypothetical protein
VFERINGFQKVWAWLVGIGISWGLALMIVSALSDPTPENYTLAASIWSAGLYTLLLRVSRRWWLPFLAKRPLRNAAILGIFNAAVIETEFLFFEKLFGAVGVAAHPNLLVDLMLTMPWYIGMVIIFVFIQHKYRFSTATVLFLGGVYEIGGDGIAGQVAALFDGNFQLFNLEYWVMIVALFLWAFIPVYSSMLLPPSWVIASEQPPISKPIIPRGLAGLLPLTWLLPFIVYILLVMVFLSALSEIFG